MIESRRGFAAKVLGGLAAICLAPFVAEAKPRRVLRPKMFDEGMSFGDWSTDRVRYECKMNYGGQVRVIRQAGGEYHSDLVRYLHKEVEEMMTQKEHRVTTIFDYTGGKRRFTIECQEH